MPPGAEVLHDSFSGSVSSNVFGNDVGDVDIWEEDRFESRPATQSRVAIEKPLDAMDRKISPPPQPVSTLKPPRTPRGNARKSLVVKTPQRRSSRRLQAMNPRLVSPPPVDEDSPPKPLSVAEKRRKRHENLSSRASSSFDQTESDESFPKLGKEAFEVSSDHTGTTAPFDSSNSSFSLSMSTGNNLGDSLSKGFNTGETDHSSDLKDVSHSSTKSRRRRSSTRQVSAPEPEPKGRSTDDLQKHIQAVLTECPDVAPVGVAPTPPRRAASSPRTPRRSRKSLSSAERRPSRDGSVPKAGSKIRFVKDTNQDDGYDDDKSRKSSRSAQTKTTVSSRSTCSPMLGRSTSIAVPPRPRICLSETKPPRAGSTSLVQLNHPRSQEPPPSPARRRDSVDAPPHRRSSSSTPKRKIKYLKNTDLAQNKSISMLNF